MTISQAALLDAIETSIHLVPTLAGKVDPLSLVDAAGAPLRLRGRVTAASHPVANLVGAAQLTPETADAAIAKVRDHYAALGKGFGWLTGPTTTPKDLGARLVAAGFAKVEAMAGMALTDLRTPIATNPAVRVVDVAPERWIAASSMMAEAYGLPLDVAQLFSEAFGRGGDQVPSHGYLAYMGDSEEPIAYSNLVYIAGTKIVLLGGAATLSGQRGLGVYRSMVARRLADARARGAEAAVIQAVRTTSAPICAQLGFREIGSLELFAWDPSPARLEAFGEHAQH